MTSHSASLAAAGRWLDAKLAGGAVPELLVVLGLGEGHLLDLLETRAPATRILALEPDPRMVTQFFARRDWTAWRESGRLIYLADPDYAGADEAWRIFPPASDAHTLLVHPSIERSAGAGGVRAARVMKDIIFGVRANVEARRRFAPRYLVNSLRNAPAIAAGHDVRALTDRYRGLPAVIAGAGPSLDDAIEALRGVSERALLISADTALRPLLTAGVVPQLAVGLDPSEMNARHFHRLPDCPDTWLVSESALDPSTNLHFNNRTFWFRVANHEPWPWYRQLGLDVGLLEVWGSVITAAFQVAVLAGCDPIIFVGADLGYTDGRPYCRGATFEFDWARRAAAGGALTESWDDWTAASTVVRVADLRGVETPTTPVLLAFRDWLLARAARSGRHVINATGAGMLFGGGIEQRSLDEALPPPQSIPSIRTAIVHAERSGVEVSDLALRFRRVSGAIAAGAASIEADRWAAFSGTGWDPAVTRAALDETALALVDGRGQDRRIGFAPAPAARVLRHLPEAMARWRAVLLGLDLPPELLKVPGEAVDPATLLGEALELLDRIREDLQRADDDLVSTGVADGLGGQPLSGLLIWPASTAWDVQIFEAILGAVSRLPFPKFSESFYSRAVVPLESVEKDDAPDHPNATLACSMLTLEWAMCAKGAQGPSAPDFGPFATWLRVPASALRALRRDGEGPMDMGLALTTRLGERSHTLQLSVSLAGSAQARAATGQFASALAPDEQVSVPPRVEFFALAEVPARCVSIALRMIMPARTGQGAARRRSNTLSVTPRFLTDEKGLVANIAYGSPRGAVCVIPRWHTSSIVVRDNGAIEPGHAWPLPIFNEIPFGPVGLVAWGWDREAQPGYVMYRDAVDAPVIVKRLPFIPLWGEWWRGRLYWSCFTSGMASWAPGNEPVTALPDLTIFAIEALEEELRLSPGEFDASGRPRRSRAIQDWYWQGDGPARAVPLGPLGAVTCRSTGSDGWTAIAYPEADTVRFESADGRSVSMTCFYAFKVAWLGPSLLVSTVSEEVLLFEDLIGSLIAAA